MLKFDCKRLFSSDCVRYIPVNSGIAGNNIEGQINDYNTKVLERNQLISSSSERHPLVQDMGRTLQSMKGTILNSLDNLIVSLNTQMKNVRRRQSVTRGQLASRRRRFRSGRRYPPWPVPRSAGNEPRIPYRSEGCRFPDP